MMEPYYEDESVTLFHGDALDLIPTVIAANWEFDCAIVDPPYGETSLNWDRWLPKLPSMVATRTKSMWCFGSMRMFLDHAADFAAWQFSQDVVWEKQNGSGFAADRFKRVHENATHWYRGPWSEIHHEVPKTMDATARTLRRKDRPKHHQGERGPSDYASEDGGPRLTRSVLRVSNMHGKALHPTEKPSGILEPLIEYACPPGGILLDPTAGSGSTLAAAKGMGRLAVGIEADERYCEVAANRLAQGNLFGASA